MAEGAEGKADKSRKIARVCRAKAAAQAVGLAATGQS
jgi:hypothetical protein